MTTPSKPKITRRRFLRGGARLGLGLTGVGLGALSWGRFVEPEWVEVTRHEVPIPNLPRAFDGFRLAQISDIHIEDGPMRHELPAICDLVNAQKADAIVITGDYVTKPALADPNHLRRGLSRLRAPGGVFGIMGNHDYFFDQNASIVRRMLRESGVRALINEVHVWQRAGARLHLAGFDDFWGRPLAFDAMAARIPHGEAAIALGHEPDFAVFVGATQKFGLMLAGHSHGGQISLPFWGPVRVPAYATRFPRGFYDVGAMKLYTNRGLGVVGLPIRFCARPEISVFTLRAS